MSLPLLESKNMLPSVRNHSQPHRSSPLRFGASSQTLRIPLSEVFFDECVSLVPPLASGPPFCACPRPRRALQLAPRLPGTCRSTREAAGGCHGIHRVVHLGHKRQVL